MLNTHLKILIIIKKMKRYFTCEIKTASRCHQVTVNKREIVIERIIYTVDSFRNKTPSYFRDAKLCMVAVFGIIFVKKYIYYI